MDGGVSRQRMKRERKNKKRKRAAASRTQREIKGASPSIDCVKIGLHLQLSYCCCLFVCLDKSCDLAQRTLCLLSIQETRGRSEGGRGRQWRGEKTRPGKERKGESHCSNICFGFNLVLLTALSPL